MVTKNFWKVMTGLLTGTSMNNWDTANGGSYSGSVGTSNMYPIIDFANNTKNGIVTSTSATGLVLGSNGDPSTPGTVILGNRITTVSGSVTVSTTTGTDGLVRVKITATVTNTSSDEITIREVGIQRNITGNHAVLVERTVLDEPVVIPGSGVAVITYTIELEYPTA